MDELYTTLKESYGIYSTALARLRKTSKDLKDSSSQGGPEILNRFGAQNTKGSAELRFGEEMREDGTKLLGVSSLGDALIDIGERMKLLAEKKDAWEVKIDEFRGPLKPIVSDGNLKRIANEQRAAENSYDDYQSKQHKKHPNQTKIQQALQQYQKDRAVAEVSMNELIGSEEEHIDLLKALMEGLRQYHQDCAETLSGVEATLEGLKKKKSTRSYTAVKDFKVEYEGELSLKVGDVIDNVENVDEYWYKGELNGDVGLFPIDCV